MSHQKEEENKLTKVVDVATPYLGTWAMGIGIHRNVQVVLYPPPILDPTLHNSTLSTQGCKGNNSPK